MKSKIVFSVLIISLICVAIFFSLKNQDNNTNNASENIDKNIEEIKNEVGITGNNELYEVITEYNGNKVLNVKDDIQYKIAFAGIIKKSIPNLDEIDEVFEKNYPKKVGVWIEQTSRAKFEKMLKECVNNEYKISDEGYLQIEKENNPNDMDKKLKKKAKEFKKDILPRKQKYEEAFAIFEGRNSYSKTDHDATFMRMKEDAMLNGQLKPGYNVQIGTENRYIVGFTIHPNPTDTKTMIPHLKHLEKRLGRLPENIVADAGYGSEENYEYLEEKNLGSYVKYNKFHWEKKKKNRENPYLTDNLPYIAETDRFVCRNGKQLLHIGNRKYVTEAGYETRRDYYRCEDCTGCPYATECKNTDKNRTIMVSHRLNELKRKANANLCSKRGHKLRSQRVVEVEQVFGRIKGCWSFRRFHLRGADKVKIEWGLLAIAHNIAKMALEG